MPSPNAPLPDDPLPPPTTAGGKRVQARRVVLLVAAITAVLIAAAFVHRGQDESRATSSPIAIASQNAAALADPSIDAGH